MAIAAALAFTAANGFSQTWLDVSSWDAAHPVETDNIVYANVPLIPNPSASPNPGTPAGIREPLPTRLLPER